MMSLRRGDCFGEWVGVGVAMGLAPLSEHAAQLEEFRAPALPPREAPWIYPTPA